jgi:hypothetical protein
MTHPVAAVAVPNARKAPRIQTPMTRLVAAVAVRARR